MTDFKCARCGGVMVYDAPPKSLSCLTCGVDIFEPRPFNQRDPNRPNDYTLGEDAVLRKLWGDGYSVPAIVAFLPGRTPNSIHKRITTLGLRDDPE